MMEKACHVGGFRTWSMRVSEDGTNSRMLWIIRKIPPWRGSIVATSRFAPARRIELKGFTTETRENTEEETARFARNTSSLCSPCSPCLCGETSFRLRALGCRVAGWEAGHGECLVSPRCAGSSCATSANFRIFRMLRNMADNGGNRAKWQRNNRADNRARNRAEEDRPALSSR